MAPVIVPSEFLYGKDSILRSDNFASLMNDKDVNVDQVTNELTPGDTLPAESIADDLGLDVLIEKFDVYQEKIGSGSVEEKLAFDNVVSSSSGSGLENAPIAAQSPQPQDSAIVALIKSELVAGRKIEAIKIYREAFNASLADSKEAVEKIGGVKK